MTRTIPNGVVGMARTRSNTVARTDTTPKTLFTLPKGAKVLGFIVWAAVNSNAGTTAVLDIGKTGTQNYFVDDLDVRTATNSAGTVFPKTQNAGSVGSSPVVVTGTYAETGTASSAGGPWTVTCLYES